MKRISKILSVLFAVLMLAGIVPSGIIAEAANENWAGAWGTPAIESGIVLGEGDSGLHIQDYVPANSTLRTTITPTIGGKKIRLKFSNYFSTKSITINETTVAKTAKTKDVVDPNTITQVTFNGGQKSVTIAAGSEVYSDAINFNVTALEDISISTYYKKQTPMYTEGLYNGVTYLANALGNRTHKENMTVVASKLDFTSGTITYSTIPFLTRLDVYAPDAYSVVFLGDSTLTNEISLNLAKKLHANGIHNVGVVMSGIIGNKLLSDGSGLLGKIYGEPLLERCERDAFTVAGVKYVIVKIGINDVLHPMLKSSEGKLPMMTAGEIIEGYKKLGQKAFARGIDVYLCTRTPYKGYTRNFMGGDDLEWKQAGEDTLLEINSWVKNTATQYNFAGYISLDDMRDPNDPAQLRPHFTTDGAHFSEYGQIAAADLIPEAAYGVDHELKDLADVLGIDPYKTPETEKPTTKPNTNTEEKTTAKQETTTAKQEVTTVKPDDAETTTKAPSGGIIISPNINIGGTSNGTSSTPNANEILVQDPVNNGNGNGASVVDSEAAGQLAGFAVLAAVAMAIIATASVMLVKMGPSGSGLARGGKGRANQKKRV